MEHKKTGQAKPVPPSWLVLRVSAWSADAFAIYMLISYKVCIDKHNNSAYFRNKAKTIH